MITLDEATILHAVQTEGRLNKSQLATVLHEMYGAAVNVKDLSSLVDGLSVKGMLVLFDTLPRTYMIHPDGGTEALKEFQEAIDVFKDAVAMTRNKTLNA